MLNSRTKYRLGVALVTAAGFGAAGLLAAATWWGPEPTTAAQPRGTDEPTRPPSVAHDLEFRDVLSRPPLAPQPETTRPEVAEPDVTLRTTDAGAYVESARRVRQGRRIDDALALVNPARLYVGQPIDANEYIATQAARELPNVAGHMRPQSVYLQLLWPEKGARVQVPVDRAVEPTPEAMYNFLNDVLAERLRQGPLHPPLQETDFRFEMADSVEEVATRLGLSLEATGFGQKIGIDYTRSETRASRRKVIYMALKQDYMTVALGGRRSHGDLFVPDMPTADLTRLLAGRRLAQVDSIKFGRVAFISIQSNEDSESVFEALSVRFSNQWAKAKLEADNRHVKVLKTVKFRYLLHGGAAPRVAPGEPSVLTASVDDAVEAILKYFSGTLAMSADSLPVPIGFTVSDAATGRRLGKSEVCHWTLYDDRQTKPYAFQITYTQARIRDQADDGFAGAGDWLVKVVANGETARDQLAIDDHRELEQGPNRTHREYRIEKASGRRSSGKQLKVEVYVGEQDDARLVNAPPAEMKREWERAPDAGIDDFAHAIKEVDLARLAAAAYAAPEKRVVEVFVVRTGRANEFHFTLEVFAPDGPERITQPTQPQSDR